MVALLEKETNGVPGHEDDLVMLRVVTKLYGPPACFEGGVKLTLTVINKHREEVLSDLGGFLKNAWFYERPFFRLEFTLDVHHMFNWQTLPTHIAPEKEHVFLDSGEWGIVSLPEPDLTSPRTSFPLLREIGNKFTKSGQVKIEYHGIAYRESNQDLTSPVVRNTVVLNSTPSDCQRRQWARNHKQVGYTPDGWLEWQQHGVLTTKAVLDLRVTYMDPNEPDVVAQRSTSENLIITRKASAYSSPAESYLLEFKIHRFKHRTYYPYQTKPEDAFWPPMADIHPTEFVIKLGC